MTTVNCQSVIEDLVEGAQATATGSSQQTIRVFYAKGVQGSPALMTIAAMAAYDGTNAIPSMFSTESGIPGFVSSIRPRAVGGLDYRVEVIYDYKFYPSTFEFESRNTLRQVKRYVDYNYAAISVKPPTGTATPKPMYAETTVPISTAVFRVIEDTNPLTQNSTYSGTINNATWFGAPAGTLICEGVVGRSVTGLYVFNKEYTISYCAEGWNSLVVWPDITHNAGTVTSLTLAALTALGSPPNEQAGWTVVQTQIAYDFNTVFSSLTSLISTQGGFSFT